MVNNESDFQARFRLDNFQVSVKATIERLFAERQGLLRDCEDVQRLLKLREKRLAEAQARNLELEIDFGDVSSDEEEPPRRNAHGDIIAP